MCLKGNENHQQHQQETGKMPTREEFWQTETDRQQRMYPNLEEILVSIFVIFLFLIEKMISKLAGVELKPSEL